MSENNSRTFRVTLSEGVTHYDFTLYFKQALEAMKRIKDHLKRDQKIIDFASSQDIRSRLETDVGVEVRRGNISRNYARDYTKSVRDPVSYKNVRRNGKPIRDY